MDRVNKMNPDGAAECAELADTKPQLGFPAELQVDPAEERALVKKLDRYIMPIMAFVYFFQCRTPENPLTHSVNPLLTCSNVADLDKQSINYAAVFGLSEDLKLTGSEFSWAISLFYFGQLCSEYPAAYLMSRLPITVFVGVTMQVMMNLLYDTEKLTYG